MGHPAPAFTILRATTALVLALIAAPTLAQDDARQAEGARAAVQPRMISLIADRQGTDPRQVPASVTILSGEQPAARGQTDLKKPARYSAAVTVQHQTTLPDPFSAFGGFTIRGVGGNRVQVLVDGPRAPERLAIGIMGMGHVQFGGGVPWQLRNLGIAETFVAIPADAEGMPAPDAADAILRLPAALG